MHNFWETTLQMNTNHTGKFKTLHAMCIPYLVMSRWGHWNHAVRCARDTVTMLQRETPDFIPPDSRNVATQFARFESGGLQHLGYPSTQGLPFADPWCKGVERTSTERVEAAGPHHHHRSDGYVVVWIHMFTWMVDIVNINFEPLTFCCVLFISLILVSLNVIDINMCKVLILCEMCYFCVWHFHAVW